MTVIIDEEEQPYIIARALSAFGTLPGSFSLAVYLLLQHPTTDPIPKKGNATFQTKRLLSVPAVKQACLEACKAYGIAWEDPESVPNFDSLSMAAVLVSIYLHKRVLRMADPAEWNLVTPVFFRDILAAGLAMQSAHKSGLGVAVLGTSAIYSAFGAFCSINKKSFKEYRRQRKQGKFFLNSKLEQELFGCSALMIAKELVQRFRFGAKIVESFVYGFDLTIQESHLPPGARSFRSVAKVLSTVHQKSQPDAAFDASLFGLDADKTSLLAGVISKDHQQSWLNGEG